MTSVDWMIPVLLLACAATWCAWRVLTTPDVEAAPTAVDASVQPPVETGEAPSSSPVSGSEPVTAWCAACGGWVQLRAGLDAHVRAHIAAWKVAAEDFRAWDAEHEAWKKESSS